MLKGFITPQKIIGDGTKGITPERFSNFLSGRKTSMGSSILKSASNNISNFSRSLVNVRGGSDIAPLISNISTNIVNNVDNSINNTLNSFRTEIQNVIGGLQKQVQSNLASVLGNFTKDYQSRVQNKEDTTPSKILKGFLSLYKNAIDFVTFFGDSRNIKNIEKNLKGLRGIFDESFNVALTIRNVINKIVKQLSNLPTASPRAGSLDLNIEVPNNSLKQSGGPSLGRMFGGGRGKALAIGAAGVATAAGIGVMGMQTASAKQEERLLSTAKKSEKDDESGFNNFLENMNNIVDKFSEVLSNLFGAKKPSRSSGSASSSGMSPASSSPESPGASPSPGGTPDVSSAPEDLKLAAFTSTLEASGLQNQADVLQVITNRAGQNHNKYGGMFGQLTAREQFSPITAAIYGRSVDPAATRAYGNLAPKLGSTVEERKKNLRAMSLEELVKFFGKGDLKNSAILINDFINKGNLQQEASRFIGSGVFFGATPNAGGAQGGNLLHRGPGGNYFQPGNSKIRATTLEQLNLVPTTSSVAPATSTPQPPKVEPSPSKQDLSRIYAPPGSDMGTSAQTASIINVPGNTIIENGEQPSRSGFAPLPVGNESSGPEISPLLAITNNPHNPGSIFPPINYGILLT